MAQSLVTLNRTLAVRTSGETPRVVKMQAFTGQFQHRTRQNEVTYKVNAIHMPEEITLERPIFVDFAASAVVCTQEVR